MENNFENVVLEYLEYIKLKDKPQSYLKIKNTFFSNIIPYFKNKEININEYLKWQKFINEKGYKYSYKKYLHYTMVAFFNYCIKFNNLNINYAKEVGNFKNDFSSEKEINIWNQKEFKRFIKKVDNIIYKNLFTFLFFTGCRLGETLALTFNDLNYNIITINKTITKENINGERKITTPKTRTSIRKIKIDFILRIKLSFLKKYYKRKYNYFDNNFYIFGGVKPLSPTTIERKKNYYCKISNVKQIRIHDFRHSHATILLSYGIPITVIAKRLGHSDIYTTLNTYSHILNKDEKKVLKKLFFQQIIY